MYTIRVLERTINALTAVVAVSIKAGDKGLQTVQNPTADQKSLASEKKAAKNPLKHSISNPDIKKRQSFHLFALFVPLATQKNKAGKGRDIEDGIQILRDIITSRDTGNLSWFRRI